MVTITLDKPRELNFTLDTLIKLEDSGLRVPGDIDKAISVKQLITLLYFGLDETLEPEKVKELISEHGYTKLSLIVDAAIYKCLQGTKTKEKTVKDSDTKNP